MISGNIAFIGAHRTGKTTLAKAVSEVIGIPYVPISTSQVFKDSGLDPSDKLDIWARFDIQKKILLHACDIWFDMDQQFICDRTPLDMLAYMLADIQANSIGVISEDDIAAYSDRCFKATRQFFGDLIIVPPAIALVFEEGKAPLSKAYIEHLHYLILGLATEVSNDTCFIPRYCTDLGDRVATVKSFLRV